MSVINTNVNSLVTQNAITKNDRSMSLAMTQLSTGKRINSAKDDAAGLAISTRMTSQIRGLNMGTRNANDAISLIQTAEGGTETVTSMLQRMRELAVQSATDTYSSGDRVLLQKEFSQLREEISRTGKLTNFNGQQLLNSSEVLEFQIGANSGDTLTYSTINLTSVIALGGASIGDSTSASAANVLTQSAAATTMSTIDAALDNINSERARMGAMMNRLTYAADNLINISQNLTQARSRIEDTEYASVTRDLARSQIIQQAGIAMLAQANQQPQAILSLLK
jgi:flagellin